MTIKEYVIMQENESNELNGYSFPEDIIRIKKVMRDKGIELTTKEVDDLWGIYSDECFAQWLGLPDDDEKLAEIIINTAKKKYLGV